MERVPKSDTLRGKKGKKKGGLKSELHTLVLFVIQELTSEKRGAMGWEPAVFPGSHHIAKTRHAEPFKVSFKTVYGIACLPSGTK